MRPVFRCLLIFICICHFDALNFPHSQVRVDASALGLPPATSGNRFCLTATTDGVMVTSLLHAPTVTDLVASALVVAGLLVARHRPARCGR
jgi:hypothetical protein